MTSPGKRPRPGITSTPCWRSPGPAAGSSRSRPTGVTDGGVTDEGATLASRPDAPGPGRGATGRLVLAIAPGPLDVVAYEAPVLARTHPPMNPLRGFVQEAVTLLTSRPGPSAVGPYPGEIADLLSLPPGVVDLVLGTLRRGGGAACDAAGRWTVPAGAPRFGTDGDGPPIWRRTRRLLCYWPARRVMLPVVPRVRLRDLVEMGVHPLRGDVAGWYADFATWSGPAGVARGLPDTVRVLPLTDPATEDMAPAAVPDAPVPPDEILVTRLRVDVIALVWCARRSGGWEVSSRMWSRPASPGDAGGEPFVPGEPIVGLSPPEHLIGGDLPLDALGRLFDPESESWRELLADPAGIPHVRRELDREWPAVLVADDPGSDGRRRWRGLRTELSPEARLLCYNAPPSRPESSVCEPETPAGVGPGVGSWIGRADPPLSTGVGDQ
ncbi:MAG: hypothetical protein JWO38_4149 [Gemmataceae bacterium]|nr:hypothetical protein [Gemmataceae bacterium]